MPPPSSAIRLIQAAIDSAFNAILLEAFLCGLYTLLLGYTLHSLLKKENKKAYASALTVLWVLVMLTFSFDWQYHRTAFVVADDNPLDTANVVVGSTRVLALSILDNALSISCNWLADALLIWRCYILWEDRRWALFPLPVLLIADIVLGFLSFLTPVDNMQSDNFIFLISFFAVSIAITFVGTSLIILRILLVTRASPLTEHTSAYRKVQRIIVESGIIYTFAMLLTGIVLSVQLTAHTRASIPTGELATYAEALLAPLSGIGPTLIAVRVGTESPTGTAVTRRTSRSRLSHLTFRRSVRNNDTFGSAMASDVYSQGASGREEHSVGGQAQEEKIGNESVERIA